MDDFALYLAAGQAAHPIADWATDQALTYLPGIGLCAVIYGIWRAIRRLRDRAAYCRQIRHELQQTRQTPHIPTQPGTDDDLLIACWDAWKANPRKENRP